MAATRNRCRTEPRRGLGEVRIIAGNWRGRRIPVVAAEGLRPTPDRVRETLFNWLQPFVPGARCLDLFAGTGALGLEALSRGAEEAVFVEADARAAKALRQVADRLGHPRVRVIRGDAVALLERPPERSFDLVFVDPPYRLRIQRICLRLLAAHGWLSPGARLYMEEPRSCVEPISEPDWEELRCREAGDVRFRLLGLAVSGANASLAPSV